MHTIEPSTVRVNYGTAVLTRPVRFRRSRFIFWIVSLMFITMFLVKSRSSTWPRRAGPITCPSDSSDFQPEFGMPLYNLAVQAQSRFL